MHIMLDIETLGTAPGSVITTIAAIAFHPEQRTVSDEFYRRIDMVSCQELGMNIDAATVKWWLGQSDEARGEMLKDGVHIAVALQDLASWFKTFPLIAGVWGNGAAFDNAHMATAYRLNQTPCPWKYSQDRCYRTMKGMFPQIPPPERQGIAHNALDDARSQAMHLIEILHHVSCIMERQGERLT